MYMKRWKVLLGTIALSLGLLFAVSGSNQASAASWHKGTPKALRGKWRDPNEHSSRIIFNQKTIAFYSKEEFSGKFGIPAWHVKYKIVGHYKYKLHYYIPHDNHWENATWRRVNNRITNGHGWLYKY